MAEGTRIQKVKDFFSTPEKPVTNAELLKLKKADPEGFEQIAEGIQNETYTY